MLKITRISLLLLIITIKQSFAISLIRDSQTENFLKNISTPIFKAANLNSDIKIHIINDNSINAFVTNGNNIFINTGTITYSDNPLGLIGVIAHETGHITGNHIAKINIDMQEINKKMALGYILGLATAIGGNIEAGQAIMLGNNHIAERNLFKYSVKHEESADETALILLDKCQISSVGLLNFFKKIRNQEKIYSETINPFTRTHPLSSNRISRIEKHIKESPFSTKKLNAQIYSEYQIIKAKLEAFLGNPEEILEKYNQDTEQALIARIIAHHRLGESNKSLKLFEKTNKNNPYIKELKGQILYESGQAKESMKIFLNLTKKLPNDPLLKIELAGAVISAKSQENYQRAIDELNKSILLEQENVMAWEFLAKLYHHTNNKLMSFYALAESSFHKNNYDLSIKYANKAKELLKNDSNPNLLLKIEELIKVNNKKIKE